MFGRALPGFPAAFGARRLGDGVAKLIAFLAARDKHSMCEMRLKPEGFGNGRAEELAWRPRGWRDTDE